jgi:putative ABC transport system permease protein
VTLGVAATVATIGLAQTAQGAVSTEFDAQRATQVVLQDSRPSGTGEVITEGSEGRLARLDGVIRAGMMWDIDGGHPITVRTRRSAGGVRVPLPITVATPGALATIHVRVRYGRVYDRGFENRGDRVAVVGQAAARQLGLAETDGSAVVFVGDVPVTILGVVDRVDKESQVLLGLVVPPHLAADLTTSRDRRRLVVQTRAGAASLIGEEGPPTVSPRDPTRIAAEVPPDPRTLRNHVESSLQGLFVALGLLSLGVGVIAIMNTTLLAVLQRRHEIGLRRALGARPAHIAALVLGEASITGAVGGVLGASVGILVVAFGAIARGWTPLIDWRAILVAPALGIVTGLVAGVYPAIRAAAVTPVSALQGQ